MRDYDREIYELEVIKERQETELIYQMRIIGKQLLKKNNKDKKYRLWLNDLINNIIKDIRAYDLEISYLKHLKEI